MLIADCGSDSVLEYVLSAGTWVFSRVVLPASSGIVEPCALALAPDGRLTVAGCMSDDVVLVDLSTLVVTPLVASGAAGLGAPKSLVWSGSTLLVASANANAVIYYDSTGNPTGVRARGVSTTLDSGIAFSPDGQRLLIVSSIGNRVVEHDPVSGSLLRTFGGVCGFLPTDAAYGPDGRIYVACAGDNGISRIDATTGQSLGSFVLASSGGLFSPRSLAFGPDGDLYVSSATGEVLEYAGATGDFLGVFVDTGGNGGGPVDPYGLVFHQGKLYVASNFPSEVKAFDAMTGGFSSTFVASGAGGLDGPTALGFGPSGDLFVTSYGDDAIRRYAGATGAFISVFVGSGSGGLDGAFDLAFRPSGAAAPQVPALSPAACAALVVCLAAAARVRSRRGRRGAR
jgi:DNA-binding beta-propeller fold protein YncE